MPDLSINLLRNVSGVGSATVREFVAAGYESLNDLEGVTMEELTQVSGVGEATAQAILDFLNSAAADEPVKAYRHGDKRKNIPPAGLAGQGRVEEAPATCYFYDPHLPPVLRFDETGEEDKLPLLLEKAQRETLSADEAKLLADALRNHQPWLEWAGKREKRWFDVDPVALHIHERVSAEAVEFTHIFIVGVNNGTMPSRHVVAEDEEALRERCLLHVAATRARDTLTITSYGRPSPFLTTPKIA